MTILAAQGVKKTYRLGRINVPVLRGASVDVKEGEFISIVGASGSGKSTLLHLLGGLDRPDRSGGSIVFQGRGLDTFNAGELDGYRAKHVGFVFQFYHLLPELNVLENVLIAAMVRHGRLGYASKSGSLKDRARALLSSFGLSERERHRPAELSGGERQRVAIARALINEPDVLLADEPTGNLDRATGERILDSLVAVREKRRQTLILVTHDSQVASRADRQLHLVDGVMEDAA